MECHHQSYYQSLEAEAPAVVLEQPAAVVQEVVTLAPAVEGQLLVELAADSHLAVDKLAVVAAEAYHRLVAHNLDPYRLGGHLAFAFH